MLKYHCSHNAARAVTYKYSFVILMSYLAIQANLVDKLTYYLHLAQQWAVYSRAPRL